MTKGGFAALNHFIKWIEYIPSTFDIHRFDIRFLIDSVKLDSLFPSDWTLFRPAATDNRPLTTDIFIFSPNPVSAHPPGPDRFR